MTGPAVVLEDVTLRYGKGTTQNVALSNLDLSIDEGEFLCVVGQSGCGKSTLLSLIAGLQRPTLGTVTTGGHHVGLMFQEASLFPWLTVRGNIELALRLSGVPREKWEARVDSLLALVRLPSLDDKRPHELSGGMRQRVALARALAQDCDVLLMDEPFAALDAITRDSMHDEIERIWMERGLTIVFVTHNVREAVRLGTRVVIMRSPGAIASELPVDLPRPRLVDHPQIATRARILHDRLDQQIGRGAQ